LACETCLREGRRPHGRALRSELCPEALAKARARNLRWNRTPRGRQVTIDAQHRYLGTVKGILSQVRRARRKGDA